MAESPYHVLDFGQVQVQLQLGELNEASLRVHLEGETRRIREQLAARKDVAPKKAVVINDASCNIVPPPMVRKLQAEWMKENRDLLGLVCQAVGFVVPNGLVRHSLTGMFWIAPLPMPIVLHETLEQALDWAITEVDRMGGEVSPELLLQGTMAIERARVDLERGGFRSLQVLARASKRP